MESAFASVGSVEDRRERHSDSKLLLPNREVTSIVELDQHRLRGRVAATFRKAGLGQREAYDYARRVIDECRDEADSRLSLMNEDLKRHPRFLELSRDDVNWWLGLQQVEQKVLLRLKLIDRQVAFLRQLEEHDGDGVFAADYVRRSFPIYGDHLRPPRVCLDRPLPPPLMKRLDDYLLDANLADPGDRETVSASFSTFNAWVREEIRGGRV